MKVIVVGAGLSGLAAAWRLFREGCGVTVLERRGAAGGRRSGHSEAGFSIDPAPQVLFARDGRLLDWINELGLTDRLLPLRAVRLAQVFEDRPRTLDPHSLLGLLRTPGIRWRDAPKLLRFERLMRRYRPLLDPGAPERAADLDYRSVADFARLYFGESVLERWIGPAATSAMLGDAEQLSRVAFLQFWAAREGGAPGVPGQGLHELARHAAEQLAVRTGVEVTSVARTGRGFAVEAVAAGRVEGFAADAVVVATGAGPAARLAGDLLVPAERDFLAQVRYAPSISLSIGLDRPLTGVPLYVRVPHAEGAAIEAHLVEPGSADGRAPTGCGLVTAVATEAFSFANQGVGDEVASKTLRGELERWYPRLAELTSFVRVGRWESAIPRFGVGAYRSLARFQRVQTDRRGLGRRLYFAGDYLAGPGPEALHRSGERAAAAVLADRDAA